MREILFKAKRCRDRKWIEGYLYRISDDTSPFIMLKNRYGEGYEVEPETVCQYTGLTDRNGVKIFEGDIVDMTGEWWDACGPAGHDSPITEVVWDDDIAGFFPFANYDCDCGVYISASGCKVIGNIHDKEE